MLSRAPATPTTMSFDATVEDIDGTTVVLDETYFYRVTVTVTGLGRPSLSLSAGGVRKRH